MGFNLFLNFVVANFAGTSAELRANALPLVEKFGRRPALWANDDLHLGTHGEWDAR